MNCASQQRQVPLGALLGTIVVLAAVVLLGVLYPSHLTDPLVVVALVGGAALWAIGLGLEAVKRRRPKPRWLTNRSLMGVAVGMAAYRAGMFGAAGYLVAGWVAVPHWVGAAAGALLVVLSFGRRLRRLRRERAAATP